MEGTYLQFCPRRPAASGNALHGGPFFLGVEGLLELIVMSPTLR